MLLRKSDDRGHLNFGWLDTYHSFSFGSYYDPRFMGYRALRVINEDRIAAAGGFPTHPHDNMEIITYMIQGELAHKDSLGNGSTIRPGEIQVMTAGTGIRHSEFNPSKEREAHLLQIWLVPDQRGLEPGYRQKAFTELETNSFHTLLVSPDGQNGSQKINQSTFLYAGKMETGEKRTLDWNAGRHGWLQLISGTLKVQDQALAAGDAIAFGPEDAASGLILEASSAVHYLLFDLK